MRKLGSCRSSWRLWVFRKLKNVSLHDFFSSLHKWRRRWELPTVGVLKTLMLCKFNSERSSHCQNPVRYGSVTTYQFTQTLLHLHFNDAIEFLFSCNKVAIIGYKRSIWREFSTISEPEFENSKFRLFARNKMGWIQMTMRFYAVFDVVFTVWYFPPRCGNIK
jgi:hypothetical protein